MLKPTCIQISTKVACTTTFTTNKDFIQSGNFFDKYILNYQKDPQQYKNTFQTTKNRDFTTTKTYREV